MSTKAQAQKKYYGDEAHLWGKSNFTALPPVPESYRSEDLICLEEKTSFSFFSTTDQKLVKNITFLINTRAGLEKMQSYRLPESFDLAHDAHYYRQGRRSLIKTPFVANYRLVHLAARRLRAGRWLELTLGFSVNAFKWIRSTGEFMNDEITHFQFDDLKEGDILEIFYEAEFGSGANANTSYVRINRPQLAEFNSNYGSNLFYFHQNYPKLYCEYNFIYSAEERFADYSFILPVNIPDSALSGSAEPGKNSVLFRKKIVLTNLDAINYPENSCVSKQFPYVFADFKFNRIIAGSYPDGGSRYVEYDLTRAKHFEWQMMRDTTNKYAKVYDKQFTAVRQFIATLPPVTDDSSEITFLKALSDTLNSFAYISINDLFYNKSNLYNLYSGDHLLKRRLVEGTVWKLTQDILNENKISYYRANIQDKRFGENTIRYRANYAYENYLIALPIKNSFMFMLPRSAGVSYFLNELPFYYEGSTAALTFRNYQEADNNKESNYLRMIKTRKSSAIENSRTENATIDVNLDSLVAYPRIKESLSGQYSTLLRPCYLNTYIDSTLSPSYFKKCTDKPRASNVKIKLSSRLTEYPFRHTFNCSEKIALDSKTGISLKDWFSFVIFSETIKELPKQDYYFDFENTDTYNLLLHFRKPTEIENLAGFSAKLDNDYYRFSSGIEKQSDTTYLLKVELQIKVKKLPKENAGELLTLAKTLNDVNSFRLELKQN